MLEKLGALVILETTLDSFPFRSFKIPAFSTYFKRNHANFVGVLPAVEERCHGVLENRNSLVI